MAVKQNRKSVDIRGIHLDLKGMPPLFNRLLDLLDFLAGLKINCVLIEYNTHFPWSEKKFRDKNGYTRSQVTEFLEKATSLNIQVVPLVQTFGHLEMVFRHNEYAKYRERSDNPAELCPLKKKPFKIVHRMIQDIMETHQGFSTHIHLGADEVWSLGSCPRCKKYIKKNSRSALFLNHMTPLLDDVRDAGFQPIIWDDMMRSWDRKALKEIGARTDLMAWNYRANPFAGSLTRKTLSAYLNTGITVWGASAFKGADGPVEDRPYIPDRIANNQAWLNAAKEHGLKAVVATGWSRYSDLIANCEGLEGSLDSLVICARILSGRKLSKNPRKSAEEYLSKVLSSTVPVQIIAITEELASWQKETQAITRNLYANFPFHGEKDRRNPYWFTREVKRLKGHRDRGTDILARWKKLHKGLAADVHLMQYVRNRLTPVKKLYSFFREAKPLYKKS